MKIRHVFALAALLVGVEVSSATVLDFENLSEGHHLSDAPYGGITWGTSTDDSFNGSVGSFVASKITAGYAMASSGTTYLYNAWGVNRLSFTFDSGPTTFNGAYFAQVQGPLAWSIATKIRFSDDLGDQSSWLNLTEAPQYLSANFVGATTIYVEHDGGGPNEYTMDDVRFAEPVPEPEMLPALGVGVFAVCRRRRAPRN